MEEKIKTKCPTCNEQVLAKLNWRENGEGEYICEKCGKDIMTFRRTDKISV